MPFTHIGTFTHKFEVSKYVHNATRCSVVNVNLPNSPLSHMSVTFPTVPNSDSGIPHCLEHLVFLGSEHFKHKGTLDKIATLSLSDGTNAHTFIDQTVYSCVCAGNEGILQLLPVYIDHLFRPTITHEKMLTEIHHIDGAGKDGGVVYCEVSSDHYSSENLTFMTLLKELYKDNNFKYNYGGDPHELETLTLEDVLRFHKNFYRPQKCMILTIGNIDSESLLNSIDEYFTGIESIADSSLTADVELPTPTVSQTVIKNVYFPSDDEDIGTVLLGFLYTNVNNHLDLIAINVLIDYLSEGSSSPFVKYLVESEDSYCSSVLIESIEVKDVSLIISCDDVDYEKIEEIGEVIDGLIDDLIGSGLDWERLHSLIERNHRQSLFDLDCNPLSTISELVVRDFLNSDTFPVNNDSLRNVISQKYLELFKLNKDYWIDLLRVFKRPRVEVRGYPSIQKGKEVENQSKMIVQKRVHQLGEQGLKVCEEKLIKAQKSQAKSPDPKIFENFSVPHPSSIEFINVSMQNLANFYISTINSSNFNTIRLLFDLSTFSSLELSLFPLLTNCFFRQNVVDSAGNILNSEDLNDLFEKLSVAFWAGLGVSCGHTSSVSGNPLTNLFELGFVADVQNVPKVLSLFKSLLQNGTLTSLIVDNVKKVIKSQINSSKRDGGSLLPKIVDYYIFNNSILNDTSIFKTFKILSMFDKEELTDKLNQLIKKLFFERSKILRIGVSGLGTSTESITDLFSISKEPLPELPKISNCLVNFTQLPTYNIIKSPVINSNFVSMVIKGPTSFNFPNKAALIVALEYLNQLEGPLYTQIRGLGISYHFDLSLDSELGVIKFELYDCGDALKGISKFKEVLRNFVEGQNGDVFDPIQFKAAIASSIYSITSSESSVSLAGFKSTVMQLKGYSLDWSRSLIDEIRDMSKDLVLYAFKQFLGPFLEDSCRIFIVTSTTDAEKITAGLQDQSLDEQYVSDLFK
ncbi:hypothetical protein P9112_001883 [Eukaryota sp. TZLM1-RC]